VSSDGAARVHSVSHARSADSFASGDESNELWATRTGPRMSRLDRMPVQRSHGRLRCCRVPPRFDSRCATSFSGDRSSTPGARARWQRHRSARGTPRSHGRKMRLHYRRTRSASRLARSRAGSSRSALGNSRSHLVKLRSLAGESPSMSPREDTGWNGLDTDPGESVSIPATLVRCSGRSAARSPGDWRIPNHEIPDAGQTLGEHPQ
jgi:hypothetical protein